MSVDGSHRADRSTAVLVLSGVLMGFLGLLLLRFGSGSPAESTLSTAVAAVVVAALFVGAEVSKLHVEVRGQALSVSMSDLPLVLGLFLLPWEWLLAARLVSAAVVFLSRRTSIPKSVFNLGLYTAEVAVASWVLQLVNPGRSLDASTWPGTYAVVGVTAALGTAAVVAAMAVLGSRPTRASVPPLVAAVTVSGALTTTLALMALLVLQASPSGLFLLAALAGVVAMAHRAYYGLLRRHTDLGQLFSFTQTVGTAETSHDMVATVLRQARELLQAETAVLRLPPEPGDALAYLPTGEPLLIQRNPRDPMLRRWLGQMGLRDALLVPLRDGDTVIGVLQVGNRLGEASTFSGDDLRLLQTLAAHAEVIWHNGRLLEQLRHEAHHDAVTGLGNRNRFQQKLVSLFADLPPAPLGGGRPRPRLSQPEDESTQAAVLLLDLDRFKEVNDALGHAVGDVLLKQVGERLTEHLPQDAVIARLGGDEFAVLLPSCPTVAAALATAEAAREGLTTAFEVQGSFLEVGASVGVVLVPQDGHDPETVLRHADVAMYAAKGSSNGIARYRADDDKSSLARLALAGELRRGLEAQQLRLHYQPKVSMDTGLVCGFEALARWQHPERGLVMPDEFIPLAETTGLIGRMTQEALGLALHQATTWSAAAGIAVNLSPRRLLEPDLPAMVERLLLESGVTPQLLTLEITENSLMTDPDAATRALHQLRDIGVRLSIDDFGTGYSALAYLQRLPIDEVKIDKSFVIPMTTDQGARAIVRAIVELAHTLNLTVVAEGVEHEAAEEALRSMGCDIMQGYYISRPLQVHQIEPWLADWERRTVARQRAGLEPAPPLPQT